MAQLSLPDATHSDQICAHAGNGFIVDALTSQAFGNTSSLEDAALWTFTTPYAIINDGTWSTVQLSEQCL